MSETTTQVAEVQTSPSSTAPADDNVSLFAILGGALIGVAAIAAAPFTGGGSLLAAGVGLGASLSGAGTIAAAAGAAAVGAAAGAAGSGNGRKEAARRGYEQGTAEAALKVKDLSDALQNAAASISNQQQRDKFLAQFFSIGYAIAACDGQVCDEEKTQIREFVLGVGRHTPSTSLKAMIAAIEASPPSVADALKAAAQLDRSVWAEVDALLQVVAEANGKISGEESAFIEKWNALKAKRMEGATA